ncbi:metallophosphoesterase [Sanguibacter sp. HDW7]|uniref:metallophosphoesterase n=1 Tax=Sanguibacter sp. HDW7 TaxID=2714931 RepID=UPI00140A7996|nr:metallophosphoesterase [Sanguibacter sp. HDW7]QIK83832.1 metallophosphoesterase [Sanguibacter sp. HDW7]
MPAEAHPHGRPGRALPPAWARRLVVVLAVVLLSCVVGVVTARADRALGPHEATYEVTADGIVTLDLGPLGTIEVDSPAPLGIGVRATVKEIPADLRAVVGRTTLDALDDDLAAYLQFFSGPQDTVRHVAEALVADAARRALACAALSVAVLLGLGLLLGRPRRTDLLERFAPHTVTLAGAVVLVLVAATFSNGSAARARLDALPASTVFAGTSLEGARITGRLSGVIEEYGGQLLDMYDDNESYYENVVGELDTAWLARLEADERESALMLRVSAPVADDATLPADGTPPGSTPDAGATADGPDPTPAGTTTATEPDGVATTDADADADVVTFLQVSDLHCNIGMAPVIRRAAQLAGASAILDTGDTTINGTAVERVCVEAFVDAAPSGTEYVVATGNHDSAQTADQAHDAGATVLRGDVVRVAGVRILGDKDARETRIGVGTVQVGEEDPGAQAERLARDACAERPDLLMIHTPYVGAPALATGCTPLQISGHRHTRTGPVRSGLGVLYVSGTTAGAAEGRLTIGPLGGVAQMTLWRFDRTSRTWLDSRLISITPSGAVEVGAAIRVPRPLPAGSPVVDDPFGAATSTPGLPTPELPTPDGPFDGDVLPTGTPSLDPSVDPTAEPSTDSSTDPTLGSTPGATPTPSAEPTEELP